MGWNFFVQNVIRRAFKQQPASTTEISLDFALFYGAVLQLLLAFGYLVFYSSYTKSRLDYGKLKSFHALQRWSVPHSAAWMLFAFPSLLVPVLVLTWTKFCHGNALNLLVLLLFAGHYFNRSIIYPLLARKYAGDTPDRNVPLVLVLEGFFFSTVNGILQSLSAFSFRYIHESRGFVYVYAAFCQCAGRKESVDFFQASQASAQDIFAAFRFAAGFAFFCWGMWTNIRSDLMLVKLRGMRYFEQRCEYSVPLPPTRRTSGGRMPVVQRHWDTSYGASSAANQVRKRSRATAANSGRRGNAANICRRSATDLADNAKAERPTLVKEQQARTLERSTSTESSGGHLLAVQHTFRRYPASVYKIPRGNWFDYISCANYFGEVCEWVGFAIMSDTYAAFSFACFTLVFLTRRAMAAHKWYEDTFGKHYPPKRKAIFPGIL